MFNAVRAIRVGQEDTVQRFTEISLKVSVSIYHIGLSNQKVIRLLKIVRDCRQISPPILNELERIKFCSH